jgi:hypothetical protein
MPACGHNASKEKTLKVHIAGQNRGQSSAIKRAFRRLFAVEPAIADLKNEHRRVTII